MQGKAQLAPAVTQANAELTPSNPSPVSLQAFPGKYAPFLLPFSVFLLALAVRLAYNLTVARNYTPIFDAALYDILAHKLLKYHCYCIHSRYETVSRAPLWPFLLTAIYTIFGDHTLNARLFYSVLGSCTCVITYLLARDLFGRRIGWLVGALAAIYSGLFLYDGWLFTESLYTFFSMGFVYALFRLQRVEQTVRPGGWKALWRQPIRGKGWMICSGICITCANLARPNGSSLFALVLFWALLLLLLKIWNWQIAVKSSLLIVCLGLALILPWTYRNYLISHRFVLVATGMGEVALGSYNDRSIAHGSWWLPPLGAQIHDNVGYTPDNDKQDTARALEWIRTHMGEMPGVLWQHTVNLWTPYHYSLGLPMEEFPTRRSSWFLMWWINTLSPIIFLLAAAGLLVTMRQHWRALLIVYLVIAQTIVLNIALYSTPRFRAPMEPLLVLLVGGAIWWLVRLYRRLGARKQGPETTIESIQQVPGSVSLV